MPIFCCRTAIIILALITSSAISPGPALQRLHSGFMPKDISNTRSAILVITSVSLFKIIIFLGISLTRYLAHISLHSARHSPKAYANLSAFPLYCSKLVPGKEIRARRKFTIATFPTITFVGSTRLAFFWRINRCPFRCGEFFQNLIISLESVLTSRRSCVKKDFVVGLGVGDRLWAATLAHIAGLLPRSFSDIDCVALSWSWKST